jgi:hypothetical protein
MVMDVLLAKIAVGRAIVRCAANGKPKLSTNGGRQALAP